MALSAIATLAFLQAVLAAPYIPKSDDEVLERLPLRANDATAGELRGLREQLNQKPDNVALASQLAQRYIEIGRGESDPRFFGYAEATLKPWWEKPKPPTQVLLLRATLRQSVHKFDAAVADLDQVLQRVPGHPQALLTRATVQQVRGEFAQAKADCQQLAQLADELVAATCLASVEGVTGALEANYRKLTAILQRSSDAPPGIKSWIDTLLAEMAWRAGRQQDAEKHFRAALAVEQADAYLLAAYADFLLDQNRPAQVVELLKDKTRADPLLLRLALAQKALGASQADASIRALQARFDAARQRGDAVHMREEARFMLHLKQDAKSALTLAQQNWQVQKEPADARVLLEAAIAAGDAAASNELAKWLQQHKLEDQALQRLLAKAKP